MTYKCSFCGKSQDQVRRLIAGPGGVYICNECIALCNEIIEEEHTSPIVDRSIGQRMTREGQISMSDKDETSQPTPTPCPECKTERALARVSPVVRLVAPEEMSPGLSSRWTEMWAFVCLTCGQTTFYAKKPGKLAK